MIVLWNINRTMASNFFKLIFLCILVCFFNFATTKAQDDEAILDPKAKKNADPDVVFLYQICIANKTTANSTYEMNLRILLSSLSSNATAKTFYNNTVLGRNSSETVYGLFMCRGDIDPSLCRKCVLNATERLSSDSECSLSKQGVIWYNECMVRYSNVAFFSTVDTYPELTISNKANISSNQESFRNSLGKTIKHTTAEAAAPQGLVPETKYPHKDSEYSENPGYISHNCSNITTDSAFQSNLKILFSNLSSNATFGNRYKMQVGTVQALFPCRGDLSPGLCEKCVQKATKKIAMECRLATEAIIWYNHCWLRYSNRSFTMETSPSFVDLNVSDIDPVQYYVAYSNLSTKLAAMANETRDSRDRYQTGTLVLNNLQTVYILAQCTLDISSNDCGGCLKDVIGSAIPWAYLGSVGGRVLYPSCILRFELFQFYNLTPTTPPSPPPPPGLYILSILGFNIGVV
ncbi:Cysteine-rich receptor protein kinase 8 [Spatholobus suberectus]|nr:Cysteine-rich receptor protein kinase 8 [Spatholobus suberectus]